jgi:hypothetical protein
MAIASGSFVVSFVRPVLTSLDKTDDDEDGVGFVAAQAAKCAFKSLARASDLDKNRLTSSFSFGDSDEVSVDARLLSAR